MRVEDFDYILPHSRIADFPPPRRGAARLLALGRGSGSIVHRQYQDLSELLVPGDVLVLNDTKVIKARLIAKNAAGVDQELLLNEKHNSSDGPVLSARVIYRGNMKVGDKLVVHGQSLRVRQLHEGGLADIETDTDLYALAQTYGQVPLPPYMKRQATPDDEVRYQTTFATHSGSVAAPTASLNMTGELISKLEAKGVIVIYITLHVGLGTFLPIRVDTLESHKMHAEYFVIPAQTRQAIAVAKGTGHRVVALGTTVARTLEYCADDLKFPGDTLTGEADIFIFPGYQFQIVDALITNFHAPRSTVLMLTAAFASWPHLKKAYAAAIAENYSFLSYGDSMFIY